MSNQEGIAIPANANFSTQKSLKNDKDSSGPGETFIAVQKRFFAAASQRKIL